LEFAVIVVCAGLALWKAAWGEAINAAIAAALLILFVLFFRMRIRGAHFDWLSNLLAIFGLPLFAILLLNSDISHRRGSVRWKGRGYGAVADAPGQSGVPQTLHRES